MGGPGLRLTDFILEASTVWRIKHEHLCCSRRQHVPTTRWGALPVRLLSGGTSPQQTRPEAAGLLSDLLLTAPNTNLSSNSSASSFKTATSCAFTRAVGPFGHYTTRTSLKVWRVPPRFKLKFDFLREKCVFGLRGCTTSCERPALLCLCL